MSVKIKFTEGRRNFILTEISSIDEMAERMEHWAGVSKRIMRDTYYPAVASGYEKEVNEKIDTIISSVSDLRAELANLYHAIAEQELEQ